MNKTLIKKLVPALLLIGTFGITSCGGGGGDSSSSGGGGASGGSDSSSSDSSDGSGEGSDSSSEQVSSEKPETVSFYYHTDESITSSTRELWLWDDATDGTIVPFQGTTEDGKYFYATINTSDYVSETGIMLIVRQAGSWAWQTPDTTVTYANFYVDETSKDLAVYVIQNSNKSLELFNNSADAMGDRVLTAAFSDWTTIAFTGSAEISSYEITEDDVVVASGTPNAASVSATIDHDAILSKSYVVNAIFASSPKTKIKSVGSTALYSTSKFESDYTYDFKSGDLGLSYSAGGSTFRVWAPTSSSVSVYIYAIGTPGSLTGSSLNDTTLYELPMTYKTQGVWELTINENLAGKYYTYVVTNANGTNEVVDPYAYAVGINGLRGYICDLDSADTKPEGWDDITYTDIGSPKDLTVYESHVQDLTGDSTWYINGDEELTASYRGKYLGYAQSGTTYTSGSTTVTTGYDHIDELGVNAVQLLPVFDHANDEREETNTYNWGYNPLNYNAVEGAYSTNPKNGKTRIVEYRTLIQKLSQTKANTRVIMDVVYNHVNSASSSNFEKLVPGYYFRTSADGSLLNGSGCGNEVKTEAPMMRQFIIDSLVHWAEDYKIMGFRFDLMGLIDVQTLHDAAEALYKVNPDIVLYGEAWTADGSWPVMGSSSEASSCGAITDNVFNYLYASTGNGKSGDWDENARVAVGAFNDAGRDASRGGNDGPGYGWFQQGASDEDSEKKGKVQDMIKGVHTGKGGNPNQVVNYLSCHDNYTLYDQFYATLGSKGLTTSAADAPTESSVAQAVVAAESTALLSEGIAFIQGGEEVMRTKIETPEADGSYIGSTTAMTNMYGKMISHNSYKSPIATNSYKWDRKVTFKTECAKIAEAVAARTAGVNSYLQYEYPANTKLDPWGNVPSCGLGMNYGTSYYLLVCGRASEDFSNFGMGSGTIKVLYCSTGRLAVGSEHTCSNDAFGLKAFEVVLLQRIK